MSSFRSVMQGFLLLAVGAVGILGFLAFSEKHDVPMMINFGVLTPIALLLGIWLIYRGIKFRKCLQRGGNGTIREGNVMPATRRALTWETDKKAGSSLTPPVRLKKYMHDFWTVARPYRHPH